MPQPQNDPFAAVSPEALAKVPLQIAKRHHVCPISFNGTTLVIGMVDNSDITVLDTVAFRAGVAKIEGKNFPREVIDAAIERVYGATTSSGAEARSRSERSMDQSIDLKAEAI